MDLLDLSRVLVIQFEFTKKANESDFTNFRAKAPNAMLFGELFFIFLNDYNDRNPASPLNIFLPLVNLTAGCFTKKPLGTSAASIWIPILLSRPTMLSIMKPLWR
jgi:hypothetical protein